MGKHLGNKTTNKKGRKKSEALKTAYQEKKKSKTAFKYAIKNKKQDIKQKLEEYITRQKNIREIIEEEERKALEEKFNLFIKEGGAKSQTFWKIRKSIMKKEEIGTDLITEDGKIIPDPEKSKQYIAEYFMDLYQAREASEGEENRTEKIIEANKNTTEEEHPITNKDEITTNEVRKIIKNGRGSYYINIPKEIMKDIKWKERQKLVIKKRGKNITVFGVIFNGDCFFY